MTKKNTPTSKTPAIPPSARTTDDASAIVLTSGRVHDLIDSIAKYEGRADLSDGVLTLPELRPLVAQYRFRKSMDAVADALRELRGEFDRGRTDPELEAETLAGAVLDTLASYLSCVAEDGTWWAETFEGLRANLERELRMGVTVEELQSLKDLGDDAGVTRARPTARTRVLMERQRVWPTPSKRVRTARVDIGGEPHTIVEAARSTTERCYHLADSDEPGKHLNPWRCERCGRFYLNEGDDGQSCADEIFERTMAAMQPAEEIGGPEGAQYVALMERIAHEAQRRADRVREQLTSTEVQ